MLIFICWSVTGADGMPAGVPVAVMTTLYVSYAPLELGLPPASDRYGLPLAMVSIGDWLRLSWSRP